MSVPEYGVPDYVRLAALEWDVSDDGHYVLELGVTNELTTTYVLSPDGAGGVLFRAESGGTPTAASVTITDAGGYYTGGNVEAALQEAGAAIVAHLADATDAHDASAVSIVDSGAYWTSAEVEGALQEAGSRIVALEAATVAYAPVMAGSPNIPTSDGTVPWLVVTLADGTPVMIEVA